MATATTSLKQKKARVNPWLIVGGVVIVLAIVGAVVITNMSNAQAQAAASAQTTIPVTRGTITGSVSGSGTVTADQSLDLAFQTNGQVEQVLAKQGDVVEKGQALAILDTRNLESQVANAQASLASAQARLKQAQQGNATPEQIAASQAALDSAQKNFDKIAAGATDAERAAAQADVNSAQAQYTAALKASQTSGSSLEAAKAAIEKAKNALNQAQAAYDRVGGASNPNIGMLPQSKDLQNATIDFQKAQADYNALLTTSGPDAQSKVASALASLQAAKKRLADLDVSPDELATAKSNLEQAKSNLAKLTAPASETDIAIQQAAVAQAEQQLKQAQLNLENATLKASFAGVITNVNIVPGSNSSGVAMTLVDRDPLHVELRLSENDVVQAALNQNVKLSIDSIANWLADGTVTYISPISSVSNGVVTYQVRVDFADTDPRVKVGMTSNVDIVTSQKENVLLVPNSALLPQGSQRVVQILGADGKVQDVPVEIGISDGAQTEIISGVNEGQQILALPGANRVVSGGGMFGN
ncbi:MAG: efflux RND transporter periplasmic adaptor subunit [Chloroflexota bacterium]|nr:MAG: efflux RND transporter periplasmic adaptor subunit [Chloroflexota bacterium]